MVASCAWIVVWSRGSMWVGLRLRSELLFFTGLIQQHGPIKSEKDFLILSNAPHGRRDPTAHTPSQQSQGPFLPSSHGPLTLSFHARPRSQSRHVYRKARWSFSTYFCRMAPVVCGWVWVGLAGGWVPRWCASGPRDALDGQAPSDSPWIDSRPKPSCRQAQSRPRTASYSRSRLSSETPTASSPSCECRNIPVVVWWCEHAWVKGDRGQASKARGLWILRMASDAANDRRRGGRRSSAAGVLGSAWLGRAANANGLPMMGRGAHRASSVRCLPRVDRRSIGRERAPLDF